VGRGALRIWRWAVQCERFEVQKRLPEMIYLVQRLILNRYAWTKPSPGRLGPTGEGDYVKENGFGHEDWNFNYELAIDDCIYGYAYYQPNAQKRSELFSFAFTIYQSSKWFLAGFYLEATFAPDGPPLNNRVLNEKKCHLLELKHQYSVGRGWSRLTEQGIIHKLKEETRWLHWKVHVKNAIRLPEPIEIPHRIYNTKNYRLVRPQEINHATFNLLRQLSIETVLPEDNDEIAFPEGRELFLKHRARERNPAVVQLAKTLFLRKHRRFFCQACSFDFEKVYGELGRGFIEAHHTIPVSQLSSRSKTKVIDIALICPNCHRMVHRKRPWLTMGKLKTILQ